MCATGTGEGRAEESVLAHWPLGSSPQCPDGAPGEAPSFPGTFLGCRGGASRAPGGHPRWARCHRAPGRQPPFGSVISCVTAVLRTPPRQLTDLSAAVPTEGTIGGGCALGAAGRAGARPPGKVLCCSSGSRLIKLRLLRAVSSVPGSRAFEVGVKIFLLNEWFPV